MPGLVLDDFLWATEQMRKDFHLRAAKFGLREIERYPRAKGALQTIIKDTVDRHGSDICSKPYPVLSDISEDVYSEQIATEVYSGYKIAPGRVGQVLRKLVEQALQTIAQLPARDPKSGQSSQTLKTLASHFAKLADEAKSVFRSDEARNRVWTYFNQGSETDRGRILRIAEEMRWAGATLNTILSRTRVAKSKMDSPNPQVRFALYVVGWLEASTGRKQYENLNTLLTAAFEAAGKEIPKWVDRLAIEMHGKLKRRKNWVRGIFS